MAAIAGRVRVGSGPLARLLGHCCFEGDIVSADTDLARTVARARPFYEAEFGDGRDFQFYRDVFKRIFDIVLVLVILVPSIVIVGILALIVAADGGMPFFVQRRVGRDGRVYRMLKLRSMCPNAEAILSDYLENNPEAKEEWEISQKLKEDPRITRIGHFMRRTSLDELPQVFNVLIGDMSLVGPRPFMENQRDLYPGAAYYRMRPGITGLWQVSARNASSFADRARFDTAYEGRLTLIEDIRLIVSTARVVMRGTGC